MQGQLEGATIVGTITDNQSLVGSMSNSSKLEASLSPITVRSIKDYNRLDNKPQINNVELQNNKSLEDLNVTKLTNLEIEEIINSIV